MADHFDFSGTKLQHIHAIDMGGQDDVLVLTNTADLGDVQTINGGDGMDIIQGTTGDDTIDLSAITVTGIERIEGGDGNDTITSRIIPLPNKKILIIPISSVTMDNQHHYSVGEGWRMNDTTTWRMAA